jgi:hypothetical protein
MSPATTRDASPKVWMMRAPLHRYDYGDVFGVEIRGHGQMKPTNFVGFSDVESTWNATGNSAGFTWIRATGLNEPGYNKPWNLRRFDEAGAVAPL